MHVRRRLRRVVYGTARGSAANNSGGRTRCRRGPSTYKLSPQHVSSVNVKFFEFTRARTRPATRRSPRAPAQSRRKGLGNGVAHATSRGRSTTSWARYVLALYVPEARDLLQRLLLPQDQLHPPPIGAGGKAHPRAVRNASLRRESAAETTSCVPGPKRVFAKAVHLGQMASSVDVDSGT